MCHVQHEIQKYMDPISSKNALGMSRLVSETLNESLRGIQRQRSGLIDASEPTQSSGFASIMSDALKSASAATHRASDLNQRLQMDDPNVGVEETAIAMNVSSLQFTAVLQARNKLLQAYNDIMNMPV